MASSDTDLEQFLAPDVPPAPTPALPEREPTEEVVNRANAIINKMKQGEVFSTETIDDIDANTKVMFLAHVLEGRPFEKKYALFDGKASVVFRTIPGHWENALLRYVATTVPPAEKSTFYNRYLSLLSLAEISRNVNPIRAGSLAAQNTQNIADLLSAVERNLSRPELLLIEGLFKEYRALLQTLLSRAQDPSFWNPPS